MRWPAFAVAVAAATLGALPGMCRASPWVHLGMQPKWAGGMDDGPADSPNCSLGFLSCTSAGFDPLQQPTHKSKNADGQGMAMQVRVMRLLHAIRSHVMHWIAMMGLMKRMHRLSLL